MNLRISTDIPNLQILENKTDYTIIIGNKFYKMNAIGSCTYLGEDCHIPKSSTKISINSAPDSIKKNILVILENHYEY